jgi:hypothetical protein
MTSNSKEDNTPLFVILVPEKSETQTPPIAQVPLLTPALSSDSARMSFNLLPEMAAAIGTQRMVELCEHFLWVTDTTRGLRGAVDASGAIIPPVWRDCSGAIGAVPPSSPMRTPTRGPLTRDPPGAPQRPPRIFNSPRLSPIAVPPPVFDLSGADAATEVVDLTRENCVMCGTESSGAPPYNLGAIGPTCGKGCYDASYDAPPPLPSCDLHGGSAALGYSRNSWGDYSTFSPLCACPAPAPLGPAHNTSWQDHNNYIIEMLDQMLKSAVTLPEEFVPWVEEADDRGLGDHLVVQAARARMP